MKKDLGIIFGLFLLIVVLLVFGQSYSTIGFITGGQDQSQIRKGITTVGAKTLIVDAEVVSHASDRKKGLSDRESLLLNQGMLFVFENKGSYGIWMKDMKFAIDIIWIDEDKNIVDMMTNAAPQPGRSDKELTIYRPRSDAQYVLEVNAGLTSLHNLQIGDKVSFDL